MWLVMSTSIESANLFFHFRKMYDVIENAEPKRLEHKVVP